MSDENLAALLLDEYRLCPDAATLTALENGRKQVMSRFLALKLEPDPELAFFFEEYIEKDEQT